LIVAFEAGVLDHRNGRQPAETGCDGQSSRRLLTEDDAYNAMANTVNPYGDGHTASVSLSRWPHFLSLGPPAKPFVSGYGSRSAKIAPKRTWASSVYSPIAPVR